MRRAAKIDNNQPAIVEQIEAVLGPGSVVSLAGLGEGKPDILVGWGGVNYLFEIKQPQGRVTPDQERFRRRWAGQYHCVEDAAAVLRVVGVRV